MSSRSPKRRAVPKANHPDYSQNGEVIGQVCKAVNRFGRENGALNAIFDQSATRVSDYLVFRLEGELSNTEAFLEYLSDEERGGLNHQAHFCFKVLSGQEAHVCMAVFLVVARKPKKADEKRSGWSRQSLCNVLLVLLLALLGYLLTQDK